MTAHAKSRHKAAGRGPITAARGPLLDHGQTGARNGKKHDALMKGVDD
jgi:hypothetical protein